MTDILERLAGWVYTPRLYAIAEEAREEIADLRHQVLVLKNRLRYANTRLEHVTSEADEWRTASDGVRAELYALNIKHRQALEEIETLKASSPSAPRGGCGKRCRSSAPDRQSPAAPSPAVLD